MGFTVCSDLVIGNYFWKQVPTDAKCRICVGYQVKNLLSQEPSTDWKWQVAYEEHHKDLIPLFMPKFGYSGTTSLSSDWATLDRIMEITFDRFYHKGRESGRYEGQLAVDKLKEGLAKVLESV